MHNARALRERHWLCARRLRERRQRLGLTQCDVVTRLAELGVVATNRQLSAIEHGQGVDIGRLPELASALECTVTYLLGLTSEPERWEPDVRVPVSDGAPVVDLSTESWILGPDIPENSLSPSVRRRA